MALWKVYQGSKHWWAEPINPGTCPLDSCRHRATHHRHLLLPDGAITEVAEMFTDPLRGWERAEVVAQ